MKNLVTCPICQGTKFTTARQLAVIPTADGDVVRAWQSSADDATVIQCVVDGTRQIWNSKTKQYDIAPFSAGKPKS